jgi:hypothetical protein
MLLTSGVVHRDFSGIIENEAQRPRPVSWLHPFRSFSVYRGEGGIIHSSLLRRCFHASPYFT